MMRRGLAVVAVCACGAIAAVSAASCGVDPYLNCGVSCLDGSSADVGPGDVLGGDGGGADAIQDAPVLPPPCDAADVACIGPAVPEGWTPIGFANGTVACPGTGFDQVALVVDAGLGPNACVCSGCSSTGSWGCNASLGAGAGCFNDLTQADASTCWVTDHHAYEFQVARTGTVTCGGGAQTGDLTVETSPVTACAPSSCSSDYCGLAQQGFALCILADGTVPCPLGFSKSTAAGTGAVAKCNVCQSCSLANPAATCTGGSLTAYDNTTCDGNVLATTSTAGQCINIGPNFQSVYYEAGTPPVPNCGSGGGPGTGSATLTNPYTVCCP